MAKGSKSQGYSRNAGRRWRAEEVNQLRVLARRGGDVRAISLRLGRPDGAIRAKAAALGLRLDASQAGGDRCERRALAAPQLDLFAA